MSLLISVKICACSPVFFSTAPEPLLEELPSKRPRRTGRSNAASEKPPKVLVDIAEDQENQQPSTESEESEDTHNYSPTKQQSRRTSIASTAYTTAPVTPSTPRHYDVFAKSATTPRHRVMSVGKISRRMTPQTPLTPSSLQTVYHQARQLFSRSADPGQLIGRDDERAQLRAFLGRCATSRPGGCLYVSGPPGTGKSAMTNEITQEVVASTPGSRKAYVNCMSVKTSKDLYMTLFDQLVGEVDTSESDVVAILQKLFVPKKKSEDVFVVVLDEIDHILTLDLESLYRVFEWSLQKTSRLTLVGIANALDLTDRFLPRLKSRDLKPELLPFLPYTAPQVKRIITTRLRSLLPEGTTTTPDFIPFFHPAAIELCSRKVSTQTGDLRRAFEVCRRALDLVENETRMKHENEIKEQILQMSPTRKVLGENRNLASTPRGPQQSTSTLLARALQGLTVETAPRVSIGHLNKVTAAAFSNGTNQRLKTLNLQQKAALCALMAIEKRNRAAVAAATAAATVPSTPSSRSQVTAPTTLSLITAVDGKTGSFAVLQVPGSGRGRKKKDVFGGVGGVCGDEKRVASCVGEREMEAAVDGTGTDILQSILSGEALD
ncbi:P-loop containing nucleoside triphosphate hydrolase protein [Cercophora newfieldiana]|uniref:Cell division control protein n=1 Tax=Cercophora newfieldiana TaxID=92897 RepID=A0AA40D203_9PEZI|nr:P-loop containing nucleoside triphosphate hydrolase protein [Cercophora newfieldiana]